MPRMTPRLVSLGTQIALKSADSGANVLHVARELQALGQNPAEAPDPPDPADTIDVPPGYRLTDDAKARMQLLIDAPDKAAVRRLQRRFEKDRRPILERIRPGAPSAPDTPDP